MGKKSPRLVRLKVGTHLLLVFTQVNSMRRERVGSEGIVSDPFYKHIVCQGKVILCVFSVCEKVNQTERKREEH